MSSIGGGSEPTVRVSWIKRINWINFWIYSGLVLGALASVSANIAYTYIPPRVQPAWWPRSRVWDPAAYLPPPGDVAVAVFCPVAIFILTEVITRPRWRDGKLSFSIRVASTALVGLPVAVASYLHLCSLLEYYSSIPFIAYSLPLTVDGLMLACTAALQLTGPEPQQTQTDANTSEDLPPAVKALMVRPRQPVDDTIPVTHGTPPSPGGLQQARTPVSTSRPTDAHEHAPVHPAETGGSDTADLVDQPRRPAAPSADAEFDDRSPGDRPGESWSDRRLPVPPPVGLVGPPVGTVLLPLQLLLPPPVAVGRVAGSPGDLELAGGPAPGADGGTAGRPLSSGRLGSSGLTDPEIIAAAIADKPDGIISASALVRAFGIGSGRAARLRDEIAEIREVGRRRLAARLAVGLREVIERQRATGGPGAAAPAPTASKQPNSPESANMGGTIKTPPELSRQGP